MIAAALLYLGMFALASGMSRHAPALLGQWYAADRIAFLPRIGWVLVALSLAAALLSPDWPRALVTWFGLAPLAAGIVLLSLTFAAPVARGGVAVAAALGVIAIGLALAGAAVTA